MMSQDDAIATMAMVHALRLFTVLFLMRIPMAGGPRKNRSVPCDEDQLYAA